MDKQKTEKAALNMRIDAELLTKAHELADKRGISLAGLVRMLLIQELEREKAGR
jgi:antitoxin component of RelBE/YafQ-DinJ toxin-antitoxin module